MSITTELFGERSPEEENEDETVEVLHFPHDQFARWQLARWASPAGRDGRSITRVVIDDLDEISNPEAVPDPIKNPRGTRLHELLIQELPFDLSYIEDPYGDKFEEARARVYKDDRDQLRAIDALQRLHLLAISNVLNDTHPSVHIPRLVRAVVLDGNMRHKMAVRATISLAPSP